MSRLPKDLNPPMQTKSRLRVTPFSFFYAQMRRGTAWPRALIGLGVLVLGLVAVPPLLAHEGDDSDASLERRIADLEEQVQTLAGELTDALTDSVTEIPGDSEASWGVGPMASKVYRANDGLSIGGYGEVRLRHDSREDDVFDALRAVLYVGYKFNDQWVVNSEFEFEHAGGSKVYTEFLNLDYLHSDALNFRIGLILIPMGFVNQLHEPTSYYGAERPEVERSIIPSTWRENGLGIFGRLGDNIRYQFYAVTSLEGRSFDAAGLRAGRQKGMQSLANDWSFVFRTDVNLSSGLEAGLSFFYGNQGQNQEVGSLATAIYDVHAEYRRHGFSIRLLLTQAFIDNPDSLNEVKLAESKTQFLAESLLGWYGEIAYDVMPLLRPDTKMSLEPFFRYERLDTQRRMQSAAYAPSAEYDRHIYTAGLQWKPISQVVIKLDYRYIEQESDGRKLAKEIQFGAGYVF